MWEFLQVVIVEVKNVNCVWYSYFIKFIIVLHEKEQILKNKN